MNLREQFEKETGEQSHYEIRNASGNTVALVIPTDDYVAWLEAKHPKKIGDGRIEFEAADIQAFAESYHAAKMEELPSDEEIDEAIRIKLPFYDTYVEGFEEGAKWMRDQIAPDKV